MLFYPTVDIKMATHHLRLQNYPAWAIQDCYNMSRLRKTLLATHQAGNAVSWQYLFCATLLYHGKYSFHFSTRCCATRSIRFASARGHLASSQKPTIA